MNDKPTRNTHSTRIDPHYKRRPKDTRGQFHAQLVIERMAQRCPGCGGRALLPCLKCYIDSLPKGIK